MAAAVSKNDKFEFKHEEFFIKTRNYESKMMGFAGTACLSGTHNPGFPRPEMEDRQPPWPEEYGVEVVTLKVGDALIFTEK